VATSGGLIGKVARVVDDHEVLLEVAENVRMRLQKHAISEVRAKGEPVAAAADDPAPKRSNQSASPPKQKKVAQKK
jgi:preprotein translocase subunit YajC